MADIVLDSIDLQILRALQENARLTTKELAARVNLSTTPVFERMKRLEKEGFIKKYVAVLDAEKLGRGFTVYCSVKLKQMNQGVARDFISVIRDIPQVAECYNISGEYDYLLKIQAPDMKYYNEFIINVLGNIDAIGSTLSSFVMNEIKNTHGLYV
jgi:Lrp/AsnC family leucine-responsive transcriptional regulator